VLYAVDDIEFQDDAIDNAMKEFNDRFKDDDGVIGFTQIGVRDFHPSGVGLVGKKFLDRYPGRKLFNPMYYHFACQEIHDARIRRTEDLNLKDRRQREGKIWGLS
jgi:hypothetical protein